MADLSRSKAGRAAEDQAADYLLNLGYALVTRRYQVRGGEIDIICLDGDVLVFVEVRFRSNPEYRPEESIGEEKLTRVQHAARDYLSRHEESRAHRYDIIAITPTEFRHHKHIFNR